MQHHPGETLHQMPPMLSATTVEDSVILHEIVHPPTVLKTPTAAEINLVPQQTMKTPLREINAHIL